MRKFFIYFSFLYIALSMVSCAKTKNEEHILHKTKSSIQYKSYYTLSKSTLPLLHKQMKNEKELDSVNITDLRIYLAYSWAASQKNALGLAETTLILEASEATETQQQIAHLINSMLLINLDCMLLSEKEFELSNPVLSPTSPVQSIKNHRLLMHLIIGIACVYNEEYEHAHYHFSILSKISPYTWPYKLTNAIILIKQGKLQQGLIELKDLKNDPTVPKDMLDIIQTQILTIEKRTGPVESKFFLLRAMGYIIHEELKNNAPPSIATIINTVEKFKKNLPFSL